MIPSSGFVPVNRSLYVQSASFSMPSPVMVLAVSIVMSPGGLFSTPPALVRAVMRTPRTVTSLPMSKTK